MLLRFTPCNLGVEVLTVDACQGSEYDYVVLSTVRSAPLTTCGSEVSKTLSFASDRQRMCVRLSRAKRGLLVVGNRWTFELAKGNEWKMVLDVCSRPDGDEVIPDVPLPEPGTFVSTYALRQKEKESNGRLKALRSFSQEPS